MADEKITWTQIEGLPIQLQNLAIQLIIIFRTEMGSKQLSKAELATGKCENMAPVRLGVSPFMSQLLVEFLDLAEVQ